MESTKSTSNMIVPEVLTEDNYQVWKIFMKSYLLGKGLWDIVEGSDCKPEPTNPEFRAWRKRNGKALHAILISCGENVLFLISERDSAKDAWDHLAFMFQQNTKGKNKLPSQEETSWSTESKLVSQEKSKQSTRKKFPSKPETNFLHQIIASHAVPSPTEEIAIADLTTTYRPLYQAVFLADWERTKSFLDMHPESLIAILSLSLGTVLHVAVSTGNLQIVEKLLELMTVDSIYKIIAGHVTTPLHIAAVCGFTKIAKLLVKKCNYLLQIPNQVGNIQVAVASISGQKETTRYLYTVTTKEVLYLGDCKSGATLLNTAILLDMYDIVIDLLRRAPKLSIAYDSIGWTTIKVLATRPNAFASGGLDNIWQQWIYSGVPIYNTDIYCLEEGDTYMDHNDHITIRASRWLYGVVWSAFLLVPGIKSIHSKKTIHVQAFIVLKCICSQLSSLDELNLQALGVYDSIFCATQLGIVEIVTELIKINPELLFSLNKQHRSIFSFAILCRQEKIVNFICERIGQMIALSDLVDNYNNNLLHVAGISSRFSQQSKIPGAALQMQRELQWFQEVEKIMPLMCKEATNNEGLKPRDLFTKQHKDLVTEGEKWLKDTANSCMVVGTLIVTFTFAAAFTVPGGNDQDSGFPIFLGHKLFWLFIISDALSLFSSSTSVLMFLSIYTSRYAEEDFLKSLPKRLIIGLSTLFFSIATTMVAFCATLFLIFSKQYKWVAIPITFLASVPVALFVLLHFPLFLDMVLSTFGPGLFINRAKRS